MSINHKFSQAEPTQLTQPTNADVVIGRFPPIVHAQSIEATRLAYTYLSAGISIKTFTGAGPSNAQVILSTKTRRKFKKSRKALKQCIITAPHTTVFCDLFSRPRLQSRTRYRRALEYIRLLRLFWMILCHARSLSLVETELRHPILFAMVKIASCLRQIPLQMFRTAGAAKDIAHLRKLPQSAPFNLGGATSRLKAYNTTKHLPKILPILLPPASNVTIHGMPDNTTGLGQNTRMSIKCFQNLGLSPSLINAETQNWDHGGITLNRLQRPIVLHHLNADRIYPTNTGRAYNIGFLLWELSTAPAAHSAGLLALDEVWAPSEFVAQTYRKATGRPVLNMKKGIEIVSNIPNRDNFDRFTCVNAFDFHSSVERKNPLATAQAFQIAFPKKSYPECRLILKTTPALKNHWGDPNHQMRKLRKMAFWDRRISMIEQRYTLQAFHKLIAHADVVVSTHRAEGFGYIPAYGLAYARPVVTTNFGGCQDFCTAQTSRLIDPHLIRVPKNHSIHPVKGAYWADVSPDAVAQQLRWVYKNRAAAQQLAEAGKRFIRREYSMSAQSARYKMRLHNLNLLPVDVDFQHKANRQCHN